MADINARAEKDHFKIKRFAVLYKLLDMDDGELTKTGKIRRKFVMEKYKDLYDALYDESVSIPRRSKPFSSIRMARPQPWRPTCRFTP